jgi:hypothetical protein
MRWQLSQHSDQNGQSLAPSYRYLCVTWLLGIGVLHLILGTWDVVHMCAYVLHLMSHHGRLHLDMRCKPVNVSLTGCHNLGGWRGT